ncbi:MAG: 16S rRNA (cytosine(1402)-N(4))-methyltransferase RsmH [Clostridia bacterium]
MNTENFNHIPVLLNEVIEGLNIKKNGIYVDGTLGGAGHSLEICKKLSPQGRLIGIDRDVEALACAKEKLKQYDNVKFVNDNHQNIKQILSDLEINGVDGILLDLGVSSYQIDEISRGFSYMNDAPLDMRMDKLQTLTAEEVINTYKEEDLAKIIYEYGEEKFSKKIARRICELRKIEKIDTTAKLAAIVEECVPYIKGQGHPAKRTFQAIRIEVNNEIEPLYGAVTDCIDALNPGGRLCIITFHSLEDRCVKNAYTDALGKCTCPKDLPYCICKKIVKGKIVNKKPILPTDKEQELNSRSRSAKLRIFEKI